MDKPNNHSTSGKDQIPDYSHSHEKRTLWVVYLTAVTMVIEIIAGYWTNSMALLADGYHMASHVLALGLAWLAYFISRRYSETKAFSFSKKKLLALSGFTSAIALQVVAIYMAIEAVNRLMAPLPIRFGEAIVVAFVGLIVNAISAWFLHHNHHHHDHNIRSAYLHVLADGLTSITAIMALSAGYYFQLYSFDSISAILSSLIITRWAIGLMIGSGKELIEFNRKL